MLPADPDRVIRRRLACRGAVQAVGFRPAVHRLATSLGLAGRVRNDPDGASVELEGPVRAVEEFERRLSAALPPLARLDGWIASELPVRGESGFEVAGSETGARRRALLPPDAAVCEACRTEMETRGDRRHRYAFTNCTDCGPRYSLAASLPYDRERTSMACFPPCDACSAEYRDPARRRFHAEPVCCPACGPRLWLTDRRGSELASGPDALARAREALADGAVVAVKGVGGFQLACRADDPAAVARLRERKRRPTRPFAVMARDLATARTLARLDARDEQRLASPEAPILLVPRARAGTGPSPLPDAIAPGLHDVGVMLPTTPLHVELFRDAGYRALVMTSGNARDEPLCRGNREALQRLAGIADRFLLHDRDVVRRVDDSVVRAVADGHASVRRSRGRVPRALALPEPAREPVLALGGHLQTTACLAVGDEAFPSQHVGDLDGEAARAFLLEVAHGLEEFLDVEARVVVADLHPDYPSGWAADALARQRAGRVLRVQHHLAHAAAVLGEHGAFPAEGERAAALVLDGTGWGTDGSAWGCEWLLLRGDLAWARLAHGAPLALVGRERAVREPWRVAVAALVAADAREALETSPLAGRVPGERLRQVVELAAARADDGRAPGPWPLATGAGRVFEAAGAILGLASVNGYEGEAAARLEALAASSVSTEGPEGAWPEVAPSEAASRADARGPSALPTLPTARLLAAAAERASRGQDPGRVAAGFHATFCRLAAGLAARVVPSDVRTLALGGGCLVNRLLRSGLRDELDRVGLQTLLPRELPAGDGGLSYGQAVLGAVSLARDTRPRQVAAGGLPADAGGKPGGGA